MILFWGLPNDKVFRRRGNDEFQDDIVQVDRGVPWWTIYRLNSRTLDHFSVKEGSSIGNTVVNFYGFL